MTDDERQLRQQLEEQLSAYLDGELDDDARAQIEAYLGQSLEAADTLRQLRQVRSLVGGLPRGQAPADLSESVIARLERKELLAGADERSSAPATPPGVLSFGRLLGAAAVILIAVLAGYLAIDTNRDTRREPVQLADAEKKQRGAEDRADEELHRGAGRVEEDESDKARRSAPADLADAKTASKLKDLGYVAPTPARTDAALKPAPAVAGKPMAPGATAPSASLKAKGAAREALADGRSRSAKRVPAKEVAGAPKFGEVAEDVAGDIKQRRVAKTELAPAGQAKVVAKAAPRPEQPSEMAARRAPGAPRQPAQLGERLEAGVTVTDIESHVADAEPVRLTLDAPSPAQQTDLSWAMRAFFARHSIQDVRSLGDSARVGAGTAFYLAAKDRADDGAEAERFVLRSTPEQITSLVDDLSRSAGQDVRVALATPDIRAEGWAQTKLAARMLTTKARGLAYGGGRPTVKPKPAPSRAAGAEKLAAVSKDGQRARWLGSSRRNEVETAPPASSAEPPAEGPPIASADADQHSLARRSSGAQGAAKLKVPVPPRRTPGRQVVSRSRAPVRSLGYVADTRAAVRREPGLPEKSLSGAEPSSRAVPSTQRKRGASLQSIRAELAATFAKKDKLLTPTTQGTSQPSGEPALVTVVITLRPAAPAEQPPK